MNLIDTYISEIGRQLPQKNRADIEAEIRSALEDMLEERSRQAGRPVDDELILATLQEYGSPEKVAASYQGERYLVGPRLYPAFIKVIQIVLPIMGVLALLGLGISLGRQEASALGIVDTISKAIAEFLGSMISALGSITIIFALLERFIPNLKVKEATWDAHSLFKISPPDRVKPGELIVEIFFTGLAILVFNFYPRAFGFTPSLNSVFETGNWDAVVFFPFLSETFMRYIPFLTGIWILTIILDAILIQRGSWEVWSRWFGMALKVLGIGIAIVMLTGPSLVTVTVDSLVATGVHTRETAEILVTLMSQGVRVGLVLAILFGGLDLAKLLIRLYRGKSPVVLVSK